MGYEIDKESKADEGKVVVTFCNDNGIVEMIEDKYVIDNKAIYEEIAKGNMVNLDRRFVESFSMMECIVYIKEHYPEVDIDNIQLIISAREVFFNNAIFHKATFSDKADFSGATFLGDTYFIETIFLGVADFSGGAIFSGVACFSGAIFSGEADFRRTTFLGEADFSRTTFSGEANFYKATFLGEADFSKTTFSGKANFHKATFLDEAGFSESFLDKADFSEAIFSGRTCFFQSVIFSRESDFSEANFLGKAYFSGATFLEKAYFSGATFSAKANFSEAIFSGEADYFRKTIFSGEVDYSEAIFSGEACFSEAIFLGEADFSRTTFSGEANLYKVTFLDEANFYKATFSGEVDYSEATFLGGAHFKRAIFLRESDYSEATFLDKVDYSYAEFFKSLEFNVEYCKYINITNSSIEKHLKLNGSVKTLNLLNVDISGKIILQATKAKDMIKSQDNTNYYEKAEQFVLLKENYNKQGKYDDEDKAYFEYKKCMRKSKIRGELLDGKYKKVFNYIWEGLWFIPKLVILEWIGGYGTKPRNVFITMLLTWLGFAGIYEWYPKIELGFDDLSSGIDKIRPLYFSVITFLTIGYGDVSPLNDTTALFAMIEGFLGVFLMSYFTVSFVRKLLR